MDHAYGHNSFEFHKAWRSQGLCRGLWYLQYINIMYGQYNHLFKAPHNCETLCTQLITYFSHTCEMDTSEK